MAGIEYQGSDPIVSGIFSGSASYFRPLAGVDRTKNVDRGRNLGVRCQAAPVRLAGNSPGEGRVVKFFTLALPAARSRSPSPRLRTQVAGHRQAAFLRLRVPASATDLPA